MIYCVKYIVFCTFNACRVNISTCSNRDKKQKQKQKHETKTNKNRKKRPTDPKF